MRKYLILCLLILFACYSKAQITFSSSNGSKKETVQKALDYSIKNADNLIEGSYISFDSYFVETENQKYSVVLVKVKGVLKGENVSQYDTIAIIAKNDYKGQKEVVVSDGQKSPPLWGDKNSLATLFIKQSGYPKIDKTKDFSKYKQCQLVETEIGIFSARFDSDYFPDRTQAVYIEGLQFKAKLVRLPKAIS